MNSLRRVNSTCPICGRHDAVRSVRALIEAKGEVASQPQQATYSLGALRGLVQRLDNPKAEYGLALPDNSQYRGLVGRLPKHAVERLGLTVF